MSFKLFNSTDMGSSQQSAIHVDALIHFVRSLQAYHLCIVDTLIILSTNLLIDQCWLQRIAFMVMNVT